MYSTKLQKYIESKGRFSTNMDVEDLVDFGKTQRLCPYFMAREGAEHSEIIFCPYNYLVDPIIREAMRIDLNDAIVVVDEAHNIEDVARQSGSFELSQEMIHGTWVGLLFYLYCNYWL